MRAVLVRSAYSAATASGEPHGRPRVKLIRVADLVASSRAMPKG